MKYQFKYYVHDNASRSELFDFLARYQNLPPEIAHEIAEQYPFYEVEFDCEYDTETKVTTFTVAP